MDGEAIKVPGERYAMVPVVALFAAGHDLYAAEAELKQAQDRGAELAKRVEQLRAAIFGFADQVEMINPDGDDVKGEMRRLMAKMRLFAGEQGARS